MDCSALKIASDVFACEDYSSLEDAYCWETMDEMAKLLVEWKTRVRLEWHSMVLEIGGKLSALAIEEDCLQNNGDAKVKKQPPDLTAGEFNRREC